MLNLLNLNYEKLGKYDQNKNRNTDKVIAENTKKFINANLSQTSNTTINTKHAIAKASLGANAANHNEVKVRLGMSEKT